MSVTSSGKRTFFHYKGTNRLYLPESVDISKLNCKIFHYGYFLVMDGMDADDPEYGVVAGRLLDKL
jgi:hypothetical protein